MARSTCTLHALRKGLTVLEVLEGATGDLTLTEVGRRLRESQQDPVTKRSLETLKRQVRKAREEISAKLGHRS